MKPRINNVEIAQCCLSISYHPMPLQWPQPTASVYSRAEKSGKEIKEHDGKANTGNKGVLWLKLRPRKPQPPQQWPPIHLSNRASYRTHSPFDLTCFFCLPVFCTCLFWSVRLITWSEQPEDKQANNTPGEEKRGVAVCENSLGVIPAPIYINISTAADNKHFMKW